MSRTEARPRRYPRHRVSMLLPWVVVPVVFVAGVAAVYLRGGDDQTRTQPVTVPGVVLGHVHGLGVAPEEEAVYIGSHLGLFRVRPGSRPERVGVTWHDTMAFLRFGEGDFLASGHPDLRTDLPSHLGLMGSTDDGLSWEPLSLAGEADFHALDAAGRWIVGYDSNQQRILASSDRRTWIAVDDRLVLDVATAPVGEDASGPRSDGRDLSGPAGLGGFLATTPQG